MLMGFAPSPTPKITLPTQETSPVSTFTIVPTQTDTKQESKPSPSSEGAKPTGNSVIPTTVIPQTENVELKIARCKAEKQFLYDSFIQKLNVATDKKLHEVFDSLQQQYNDTVSKIYSSRDSQIAYTKSESGILTGAQILSSMKQDSDNAAALVESLYQNQQTNWKNLKATIENSKQQAIDEINVLLNAEYSKCLDN